MSRNLVPSITEWFEKAVPEPGFKNQHTQLGVHYEEVAEMTAALRGTDRVTQALLTQAILANHALAMHLKTGAGVVIVDNNVELLDACCDQIVTATGVAYMLGYDLPSALAEVNASNWSKFVDGKPIFDANQKIRKGPNYFQPMIDAFTRRTKNAPV